MSDQEPLRGHVCGPSSEHCQCNCPDSCEHDFSEYVEFDYGMEGSGETQVCSRCGVTEMEHDMWVLP